MINGSGCEKCPAINCDAQYRGSRCSATRHKFGLGDPQTVSDRLRAMSDDELADEIAHLLYGGDVLMGIKILNYLKQEVQQ